MNRFAKLSVKGFRRLLDVSLEIRQLAVLIGANGIGKTSILDAFNLLSASAESKLSNNLNNMGGIGALATYDKTDTVSFCLTMEVPKDADLHYEITLSPMGAGYTISKETLNQQRKPKPPPHLHIDSNGVDIKYYEVGKRKLVRPTWPHNPLETSLAQVPKMFHAPEEFRSQLASSTFYHALNVAPRAPVRLPQPMQPAALPGRDGEDLVSCLYYLRETDRCRFEAVEDTLRAAFPTFERLEFPPVAAGTIALTWRDQQFSKPFYTHQLSEGTLRFLWLVTLLQSPGLTAVTLIDEPEVSLHPEMLSLLADLFREASRRTQLIVATHSDRLVRFLEPKEVVVMDLEEDGAAKATWADELDLAHWLEDYALDEVWRMGRMGGRAR